MDILGEKFEVMREVGIYFYAFAIVGTFLSFVVLLGVLKDVIKVVCDVMCVFLGVGIVWLLLIG